MLCLCKIDEIFCITFSKFGITKYNVHFLNQVNNEVWFKLGQNELLSSTFFVHFHLLGMKIVL